MQLYMFYSKGNPRALLCKERLIMILMFRSGKKNVSDKLCIETMYDKLLFKKQIEKSHLQLNLRKDYFRWLLKKKKKRSDE